MNEKNDYEIPNDALVILIGVAGSGKSTIAKKLSNSEDEVISSDNIREELFGDAKEQSNPAIVFEEFHRRIDERLANGQIVIADATSLKDFGRKNLYDIAIKHNRPIRVAIMNITLQQALEQNRKRDRQVPEGVIIKMHEELKRQYMAIDNEIKNLPNAKICDIGQTRDNLDTDKKEMEI